MGHGKPSWKFLGIADNYDMIFLFVDWQDPIINNLYG